jgi:hypothetical protein
MRQRVVQPTPSDGTTIITTTATETTPPTIAPTFVDCESSGDVSRSGGLDEVDAVGSEETVETIKEVVLGVEAVAVVGCVGDKVVVAMLVAIVVEL